MKSLFSLNLNAADKLFLLLPGALFVIFSIAATPPKQSGAITVNNSTNDSAKATLAPPLPKKSLKLTETICVDLYIDNDGDGYDNGIENVCYDGINIPQGYSETTNGPDCDDTDGTVWQTDYLFIDGDGDGYDNGSELVCWDGTNPPSGYNTNTNGTDCDDTDPNVWQSDLLYVDLDGDGYDNGSEMICWDGINLPSGYSDYTVGHDCNDNDPNIWQSDMLYVDQDGDGYDNGQQMVCWDGSIPPPGFSTFSMGSDCNDNDPNVWQNGDFYFDGDGDGYDDGTGTTTLCYGFDPPAGYVTSTLGPDCNDSDPTIWVTNLLYIDQDDDQHDNGQELVCWDGINPPPGYQVKSIGHDCDDTNPDVWRYGDFYFDGDGDGYDDGSGITTKCYGLAPPEGFVLTTLGTDCDDTDPSVWQTNLLYIDQDGDGYDNGDEIKCYGSTLPEGYSLTTKGHDCDDADPSIWGAPPPPEANGTSICSGDKATLSATGRGDISWYDAPTGGNLLINDSQYLTEPLTTSTTFYAEDYTCLPSSSRTAVTVTINPLPTANAGADRSIYSGGTTRIGSVGVPGNTYSWTSEPDGFTSFISNPEVSPDITTNYTLVETIAETGCTNTNSVNVTILPTHLLATVYLDAVFNTNNGSMNTTLKSGGFIPLSQPYNVEPWNYSGTENVPSIPADIVDWVLIELRQAPTPEEATPGTVLSDWPKACFLKSDGTIVTLDGSSLPDIGNPVIIPGNNLYLVIRHRNHIAIMSSTVMTISGANYVYDFTGEISKAYGGSAGYKQIVPGICAMAGGDMDKDGSISTLDFTLWATDFGKTKCYLTTDVDEDGQVSVLDFTKWAINFGLGNIPPLKGMELPGINHDFQIKYKCQVP